MDTITKVSPRERQLLDIARRAKRLLAHESHGQHEDILIGRELVRILALYDDVEPIADADRRPWLERHTHDGRLLHS